MRVFCTRDGYGCSLPLYKATRGLRRTETVVSCRHDRGMNQREDGKGAVEKYHGTNYQTVSVNHRNQRVYRGKAKIIERRLIHQNIIIRFM